MKPMLEGKQEARSGDGACVCVDIHFILLYDVDVFVALLPEKRGQLKLVQCCGREKKTTEILSQLQSLFSSAKWKRTPLLSTVNPQEMASAIIDVVSVFSPPEGESKRPCFHPQITRERLGEAAAFF